MGRRDCVSLPNEMFPTYSDLGHDPAKQCCQRANQYPLNVEQIALNILWHSTSQEEAVRGRLGEELEDGIGTEKGKSHFASVSWW